MDVNKTNEVMEILNKIMEYELSGVVRYTHYALMITGRDRLSLAQFFKDQATESLLHAQEAGEIVTGLGGHPPINAISIKDSNKHEISEILKETLDHEQKAISVYYKLLNEVSNKSIYLEEYSRSMIQQEELHSQEVEKMIKTN